MVQHNQRTPLLGRRLRLIQQRPDARSITYRDADLALLDAVHVLGSADARNGGESLGERITCGLDRGRVGEGGERADFVEELGLN